MKENVVPESRGKQTVSLQCLLGMDCEVIQKVTPSNNVREHGVIGYHNPANTFALSVSTYSDKHTENGVLSGMGHLRIPLFLTKAHFH